VANRIFYGCLGIAPCKGSPIQGVRSVGLSSTRSINTIFSPGDKNLAGSYPDLPDIEVSYVKYLEQENNSFDNEAGLNDYTGFVVLAGDDTAKCLGGKGGISTISFNELLLSSVTYNMSVDGPFTVERKYNGFSSGSCSYSSLGVFSNCNNVVSSNIKRRGCLNITALPSEVSGGIIQSISINFKINRQFLNEFATLKPYASYISFPIETSCTFEIIAKSLSSVNFPKPVPCVNPTASQTTIGVAGLSITKASLTGLTYSGAEAQTGGSNLVISATYTSNETPAGITEPFILL
jgi:hypothetical protein